MDLQLAGAHLDDDHEEVHLQRDRASHWQLGNYRYAAARCAGTERICSFRRGPKISRLGEYEIH